MIIYLKFIVIIAIMAISAGIISKVDDIFYDLPMDKSYLYLTIMTFVGGVIIASIVAFSIWLFTPELTALEVQGAVK